MKIAFVTGYPVPYHTPILNELAQLVDLHVVYMSQSHPLNSYTDVWGGAPRYSHTNYWSVPIKVPTKDFRTQVSVGVSSRLTAINPDVVLVSTWGPLVWEPLLWKTIHRRRAVMWAESTAFTGLLRGRLSNHIRNMIVSQADALVTNGSKATEFLSNIGLKHQRIVTSALPSTLVPTSLDGAAPLRPEGAPHFLFVGRLIARKRPLEVIQSFASVADQLPGARLTVVGDGPLMDEVTTLASSVGEQIVIAGHVEGEALRSVYSSADILVIPSLREVWGLVVNEALAHGLYVIASDEVASAHDLVTRENGCIVPASDLDQLTNSMIQAGREVALDSDARLRRASSVLHCTPKKFAQDIAAAAILALQA